MLIRTRLQKIRKSRGVSVAELARLAGVSRPTIYSIEDGSFVPNTSISLRLARALGVSVEEIFSIEEDEERKPIQAELLDRGDAKEGQLVRVCRVKDRLVAVPVPSIPAYLPAADGVIESRTRRGALIRETGIPEAGKRLLIAGCDPALSLLNGAMQTSGIEIVNIPCSSRQALEWLKAGRVDVAGSHLYDRRTGDYNVPIIRRLLPKGSIRVITFATWEQGLVVGMGNPKGIRSIGDLAGRSVTIMNREIGSGSRDLLDNGLRELGIPPERVRGYDSIAEGHLAAAYAVASRTADCCIAPRSAARCFGLDFVPLAVERFDLSFSKESLQLPAARALLDLLNRSNLRKKLEGIAGYDTAHTGEVLM